MFLHRNVSGFVSGDEWLTVVCRRSRDLGLGRFRIRRRNEISRLILEVIDGAIHQECTHRAKLGALKRFGEDIGPHLLGGAVLKIEFTGVVEMSNEEVFGLRAGNIAILHQRKCTHIVLIDDVSFDFVSLSFKELTSPEDIT